MNRHNVYLGYQKFERSVTTVLATMLARDTCQQLLLLLQERHVATTNGRHNSSTELDTTTSSHVTTNKKLQVVPIKTLIELLGTTSIASSSNDKEVQEVTSMIQSLNNFDLYENYAYHISLLRQFVSLHSKGIPIATQLCLRDENGQIFLSRLCTGSDLISSNQCIFEDSVPYLGSRRRILYSLNVPCSEDDGRCDDVPSASSNLNPCLTRRMLVDVSNTGKKYTGDETVIPYTSPSSTHNDPTHDADDSYRVHPTFVTYDFIPHEYMALLEVQRASIDTKHLKSSIDADGLMC